MKNKNTIFFASMFVVILLTCFYYIKYVPHFYEKNYFDKLEIKPFITYDEFIKTQGKPTKIETKYETKKQVLTYDGFKAIFNEHKTLDYVSITTTKYRFGDKNIGVGSTIQEVKDAYKNQMQISDTDQDEIGYIDGYLNDNFDHNHSIPWVFFNSNEKQIVIEVRIFSSDIF